MTLHREDAYCPACPDPAKAFRIKDVGMKLDQGGFQDEGMTIKATRRVWEPLMLEHLRATPDEPHQRLHSECVAFLADHGQTVEENVRASLQAVVDSVHQSFTRALRPDDMPCCNLHNERCEPPGDLCCHDCTEASHDTFPIRHADGSTCVTDLMEEIR